MHLVSDFCNRVSRSNAMHLKKVSVKTSKVVLGCLFVILKIGFILGYKIFDEKYTQVYLKYVLGKAVIRGLFSLSKPSLKFYITCKQLQNFVFNNLISLNGFALVSTSYGKKISLDIETVLMGLGGFMVLVIY